MVPTPKGDIPRAGLLVLTWVGFALATILTVARLWIRHVKLRKFFWDDAFHMLALLTLFISAMVYCWMSNIIYNIALAVHGLDNVDLAFFISIVPQYMKYQFGVQFLFWITLWSVKIAFLLFYRRFFDGLIKHIIAWWVVMVFTIGSFIGCCIQFLTVCGSTAAFFQVVSCGSGPSLTRMANSIKFSTTVDVLSDVMIMALPLRILWDLRITMRQKIGLAGLFSLAMIIIAFAIVRGTKSNMSLVGGGVSSLVTADPVALTMYSVLESSVAVIVSCLPTFRALFVDRSEKRRKADNGMNGEFACCPTCGRKRHWRWPISINININTRTTQGSSYGTPSDTAVCSPRSDGTKMHDFASPVCSHGFSRRPSEAAGRNASFSATMTKPKMVHIKERRLSRTPSQVTSAPTVLGSGSQTGTSQTGTSQSGTQTGTGSTFSGSIFAPPSDSSGSSQFATFGQKPRAFQPLIPLPGHPESPEMIEQRADKPLPDIPQRRSMNVPEDIEAQRGAATAFFRASGITMESESYEAFMRSIN